MKFEISKKTLIIIASSIGGIILLWGIVSAIGHRRYDRNDFGRGCGGNQAITASGMENILATKDYAAFQTLFSGSRMVEMINTPEKFATRVELQTTMKTVQDLQAKLWSGNKNDFVPMMFGGKKWWFQGCGMMWGRWNERENGRGNMMRRR